MIPPKKLSTIAKKYNPDLLNKWITLIGQNYIHRFLYLKDEVLKEKNHPEWFLRLKNLTKKEGIVLWNEFIDFCLREAQKLNYEDFSIDFSGCTFENEEECNFSGIELPNINFYKAIFKDKADFQVAIFKEEANFENATFQGEAIFKETLFETAFDKKIDFSKAIFKGVAYFTFPTKASNPTTDIYAELSFENAIFEKETTFHRRKFFGDTSFIGAEFHFPPAFSPGEEYNPHLLNFTRTKLILSKPPQTLSLRETDIKKENKKIDSKPLTRVRNLRKLAGQIKEHDFERDLFILERLLNSRIAIKKWRYNPLKWIQQLLIGLYWISSNYGRSALIPFLWWVGFILGLSSFLSCVNKFNFWDALIVSATNAIPFFNKFSEKSKSILVECFLVDGLEDIPNWFFWMSTIHSLFSIVMIFLFSLAIRNYFRIK